MTTTSTWAGFKYATPRNPARKTYGGRIAKIARALDKPGFPYQREIWDVGTEIDAAGNLCYEIVFVTVPRQTGKTTLYTPVQLDRAIMNPGIRTFYTAQTGKDAKARFMDMVALLQESPLNAIVKYRYSSGDEAVSFPNGSAVKIFAPVFAALHGETPPLVGMDEIWEFDELLGDALLEGAIIPAQVTLAGRRQVWLFSTAGTAASTFMKKWVDRGRESVITGGAKWPKMAYFEASLADGDDPYDPEAIARFHPGVGYTVTVEELLETAKNVSHAMWMRSFCNVWTEALNPIMPSEDWAALQAKQKPPRRDEIAITWEIAPDSECGAVMASWRDDDGKPNVRVLHAAPGTVWMEPLLLDLYRWNPVAFGADNGGPTRRLNDQLRRKLGDDAVRTLGGSEFSTACETFLNYAFDSDLKHDGSLTLSNAMAHLVLKRTGDVTSFSRSASSGPIAGLIAGAVGMWLWDHRAEPLGKPEIYS